MEQDLSESGIFYLLLGVGVFWGTIIYLVAKGVQSIPTTPKSLKRFAKK